MSGDIRYAEGYTAFTKPVKRYGPHHVLPGQLASGYGSKISTDYMVQFPGERIKYRVYMVCYSNAGSCYIVRRGEKLWIRSHELEVAVEQRGTTDA